MSFDPVTYALCKGDGRGEKVYVIPQMFGAKADGVTDDSAAIQAAIDSNEVVYFPKGTYRIDNSINLTNKENYNLYAEDAHIRYYGNDYAFKIKHLVNCNLNFGRITADNGGCLAFISDTDSTWSQYVNIDFVVFYAKTNCIYAYVNAGWVSEIRVNSGRFAHGECGVKLVNDVNSGATNVWKFHHCGIEGVTTGFDFEAAQGEISAIAIDNCRASEGFTTLLKTVGYIHDCLYEGTSHFYRTKLDLSERTNNFKVIAPILNGGGGLLGNDAVIDGGVLLIGPANYAHNYINIGSGAKDLSTLSDNESGFYSSMWGYVEELRLSKYYGRRFGVNHFTLRFVENSSKSLTVYDYQGNVIFNNLGDKSYCDLVFEWTEAAGWRVAVMTPVWTAVKTS